MVQDGCSDKRIVHSDSKYISEGFNSLRLYIRLWNALVPDIFGWSRVGYWQMLGLLALVHLLFGNMHGSMSVHKRHHDFHKRMHGMSREERREFIRRHMHVFDCEENPTDDAGKKE